MFLSLLIWTFKKFTNFFKFMFSKKATKTYLVNIKSTVNILLIFVAFLENMNFNWYKNECFWQRITCSDCIWWIFKSDSTTLICLSVFTHTLNCCVNVIIYASFGKMFQQTFFELFCTKFQEEQVKKERSVAGTPISLRTTFTRKITVQSETMANTSPAWLNHR